MTKRLLAVGLATLVVLAGCGGQTSQSPTVTTTENQTPAATTAPTSQTTAAPDNPWQSETVTVSVDTAGYENTGYRSAAKNVTEYWNNNAEASSYSYELEFSPNETDADVEIVYTPRIQSCADEFSSGTFYYCFDTSSDDSVEYGTTTMRVAGGYEPTDTEDILQRAFADLLSVSSANQPPDFPDEVDPQNTDPWPTPGPVTVAVSNDVNNRSFTPLVKQAVRYWENTTVDSMVYATEFEVQPNASDADVLVTVVDDLQYCGGETDDSYVGCAPRKLEDSRTYEQDVIQIEAGFTPTSTLETIKHEFGHLHGVEHGESPMPLMAATGDKVAVSEPNATERDYPWLSQNLTVAVTGSPTDQQRQQIEDALNYFERGADGLLTDTRPSFTMTDNATTADIVIDASNNGWACGEQYEGGSCSTRYGYDEDVDDALEYYSEVEITLAATDSDTSGWHVGYWLAIGFGARGDELPESLDGENDNRDGNWWE